MAMVSHELRTPLTGVLSLTELLAAEVGGLLTPRQAKYVRGISQSGARLLEAVKQHPQLHPAAGGHGRDRVQPGLVGISARYHRRRAPREVDARHQTLQVTVDPHDLPS